MKKLVSIILALSLIFCFAIPTMASVAYKTSISSASATKTGVTFSGTTVAVKAAVVVQVLNNSSDVLAMGTAVVESDGSFSGTISVALSAGTSYTVRTADYEGSDKWYTTSVTVSADPAPYVPVSTIVTEEKFELKFTDVKDTDWFYDSVVWAAKNKVTEGTSETTFSPADLCSRAQIVTFLWNAMGNPAPKTTTSKFKDVKEGAWYYEAVLWAVENGVTDGTSETTFSPAKTCTRAEAMQFIWNCVGKPAPKAEASKFKDVKASDWYYSAVLWGAENGVTDGTSETTFSPAKTCTRAEIITFLYNYLAKEK